MSRKKLYLIGLKSALLTAIIITLLTGREKPEGAVAVYLAIQFRLLEITPNL